MISFKKDEPGCSHTFSFSCSTSLSFLFFQVLNLSESSLICLISCVRCVFIACYRNVITVIYVITRTKKMTTNVIK